MTQMRALQPDNNDDELPSDAIANLEDGLSGDIDDALADLQNLAQETSKDMRQIEGTSAAYSLAINKPQEERTHTPEPEPETQPEPAAQPSDPIGMRLAALQKDIKGHEEMVAQLRQYHAARGADLHAELDQHRREAKARETALLRELEANQAELDAALQIHSMLLQSNHAAVEVLDPPPANVKMLGKVAVADRPKRKLPRKAKATPPAAT